jgi:NAD(P)-dependent dehydrogenase (short-subunit alcohol dehydrogenase family)
VKPVAIVTGASRGIGRAVARGLGAAGYAVVVAARTEREAPAERAFARYAAGTVHDTARLVTEAGGTALAVRCDVSRSDDLRRLIDVTCERFDRIDVLVANAGIDCEGTVVDLDVEALDRCLAVNVRAPLLLAKFALPGMIARGSGSIVAITSGAALDYRPRRVAYSMSKAALERAFLSLAEEVRPHDIAVNLLAPGRVDTWMNRRGDWPGTDHIPLVEPDAIVPAAVWLAGQRAATFTGRRVERADFGVTWGAV